MIYDDTFLENGLGDAELQEIKQTATDEVSKLGVEDTFLTNNLIRCRFYMLLSNIRAENEEAKLKYSLYEKDFDRYLALSKSPQSSKVKTVKLFRS